MAGTSTLGSVEIPVLGARGINLIYSGVLNTLGFWFMTIGLKIWHLITKPLFALFEKIGSSLHEKSLRQSLEHPIVRGHGRDAVRLYENGRSVVVEAELMSGGELDRLIYRHCPLAWDDTGKLLTPEEKERVFQKVCGHFDSKRVRWKFSEAAAGNWK